jgi:hypothetical protein
VAALCYVIRVRLEKEMQEAEWTKGKGRREKLSLGGGFMLLGLGLG